MPGAGGGFYHPAPSLPRHPPDFLPLKMTTSSPPPPASTLSQQQPVVPQQPDSSGATLVNSSQSTNQQAWQRAPKLGSVVPEISLMASTPVKVKRHYFQVSGSTVSSSEFLGILCDRRHSDSYFNQRRLRKRHQKRGMLHPKYSYSPNPR